jgi:hypothetical protein
MHSLLMKTRKKAVTYRIDLNTKKAIEEGAKDSGKSENAQMEYYVRIGVLATKKINMADFSDIEILRLFKDIFPQEPEEVVND